MAGWSWYSRIWTSTLCIAWSGFGLMAPVLAKPTPAQFPPNPLEQRLTQDPLLPQAPSPASGQELTPAQRQQLAIALDQLNQQAATAFAQGDRPGAFTMWNRELQLRRILGPQEEIPALGRVGQMAWQSNQSQQLLWVTQRLDAIATGSTTRVSASRAPGGPLAISPALSTPQLAALGLAYEQLRSVKGAIAVYEQLVKLSRDRQDSAGLKQNLQRLALVNLDWFKYPAAAQAYEELLAIVRATKPTGSPQGRLPRLGQSSLGQPSLANLQLAGIVPSVSPGGPSSVMPSRAIASGLSPSAPDSALTDEIFYLTQLAYIHTQLKQSQAAIGNQQQLIPLVTAQGFVDQAVALRIKIGDHYRQLAQAQNAERSYQEALAQAQPLFLLHHQAQALRKLADLYRDSDKVDVALRTYTTLIQVEAQSYNRQGVMEAYEQLGNIYTLQRRYPQAQESFQWALNMAQQLNHRVEYFQKRVAEASQSR